MRSRTFSPLSATLNSSLAFSGVREPRAHWPSSRGARADRARGSEVGAGGVAPSALDAGGLGEVSGFVLAGVCIRASPSGRRTRALNPSAGAWVIRRLVDRSVRRGSCGIRRNTCRSTCGTGRRDGVPRGYPSRVRPSSWRRGCPIRGHPSTSVRILRHACRAEVGGGIANLAPWGDRSTSCEDRSVVYVGVERQLLNLIDRQLADPKPARGGTCAERRTSACSSDPVGGGHESWRGRQELPVDPGPPGTSPGGRTSTCSPGEWMRRRVLRSKYVDVDDPTRSTSWVGRVSTCWSIRCRRGHAS